MPHRIIITVFLLAASFAAPSRAGDDDNGLREMPLLSTGTTVMGETLHYPTGGAAHVTAAIATLAPGTRSSPRRTAVRLCPRGRNHGRLRRSRQAHLSSGDALMEAMNVPHFGADTGTQPVRLLIVYMGAEGAANAIPER